MHVEVPIPTPDPTLLRPARCAESNLRGALAWPGLAIACRDEGLCERAPGFESTPRRFLLQWGLEAACNAGWRCDGLFEPTLDPWEPASSCRCACPRRETGQESL